MHLIIVSGGPALIQDGGRPGRMHEAVPPGGALVPELLRAANLAAGNDPDAAAIEHFGPLTVEATEPMQAATGTELLALAPGLITRLHPRRARAGYLAVAGGLDVPVMLGGRGALLVAGLGRPLRAGDRLPVGRHAGPPSPPPPVPTFGGAVRVVLGPDHGDVATLLASTYTVTAVVDRAGTRLTGPPVRARAPIGTSAPMVRGAIQTTPSGELIVLGPDHPTTGGYPVVAVIHSTEAGRVLGAPTGTAVRFTR